MHEKTTGICQEKPLGWRHREPQIIDSYELSPFQAGMLFHSLSQPNSGIYIEQVIITLGKSVTPDAIAAVWREIVERHPVGLSFSSSLVSSVQFQARRDDRRPNRSTKPIRPMVDRSSAASWTQKRHEDPSHGRRQPRVACWRGRVGKLKLLCILLTAFGIERTVCRLDILEALSGLRNAPSDSEIIGLSFDHQSVSPGRKHEIGDHWT
jgi:hypothetical protein